MAALDKPVNTRLDAINPLGVKTPQAEYEPGCGGSCQYLLTKPGHEKHVVPANSSISTSIFGIVWALLIVVAVTGLNSIAIR